MRVGEAAEEILGYLEERVADLVVVGGRRHDRLAEFLLDRVTEKIAGVAPCHVLVVH